MTRRAEIKKTFMNILKLCQTEEIQLLLIAGYFKGIPIDFVFLSPTYNRKSKTLCK